MGLLLATERTASFAALYTATRRDGSTVRGVVACRAPITFLDALAERDEGLRKSLGFGQVDASGERWITLHPRGDDQPGQPVKIRESKTERGTWHVVAGAGGSLNYLKLTGVKSPAEYRERAKAKKAAAKSKADQDQERERQRKGAMTDDERKAEGERERAKKDAAEQAHVELTTRQHEFVAHVAKTLGWKDADWQFDATRKRLTAAGATPERITQLEAAHHTRMYARASDAVAQSKRAILADRDAALENVPLVGDDPEKLGLRDLLDKPATPKGKGFQSITKTSSDEEIRAALAGADKDRLRTDLAAARADLAAQERGDDRAVDPMLAAHVEDLAGELHTAELLEQAASTTPEEIAARRAEVKAATTATLAEQGTYTPTLETLRTRLRGAGDALSADERDQLDALELRAREDTVRLQTLRTQAVDLAVVAGETVKPAIAGEAGVIRVSRQTEREAEIRAEHGEAGVQAYRAGLAKLREGGERYRAEIQRYRETGALEPPTAVATPITDPEQALQLLAKRKALGKMERDLARAESDHSLDTKMFGKGYFTAAGAASPAMVAAASRDLENLVHEKATRAFLEQAESPELLLGHGGTFTDDVGRRTLGQALERHLSAGAYNALNNASLAALKTPVLSREVVDTLGAAGAAQLLAHVIAEQETPATLRAMAEQVGAYHVQANVAEASERIRETEEALDRADEAMAAVTSPADVEVALAANAQRQAALEDARQTIGQALGEYEATAALAKALGEGTRKDLHVNLGPIGTETAIRQLRALGLDRSDYAITSDGTNYFATVQESGFAKLAQPVDPARVKLTDDVMAIKRGERDEPNWKPAGTITRPASTFSAPGLEPSSLTASLKPLGNLGDHGDPVGDLREHLALRAANGEDPNDLLASVHRDILAIPAAHRGAVEAELSRVFPPTVPLVEHGKAITRDVDGKTVPVMVPTKADAHAAALEQLVTDHFKARGLDRTAALHSQRIAVADDKPTREAFTRALAEDPRAQVAFAPIGDLTDQDQRTLRHYFATDVAKTDAATGYDQASVDRKLSAFGPEPTKTSKGLFGEETTPEWLAWKQQRDSVVADAHGDAADTPRTTSWTEYTQAMGGTQRAYETLQDGLKSRFLHRFHQAYTTLHDTPLRIATRPVAHAELHASYLDPAKRAALLGERRQLLEAARTRAQGKYAEGSALEKMARLSESEEIARQNQLGLLGATREATSRVKREPGAHERYTLGQTVEQQIASLMPSMAQNFKPGAAVKLMADMRWSPQQQRTIKQFERTKRLAAALSTGSGKTAIGIGALTDLRAQPKSGVKRGLFVVPSSVQGQFGSEFTRFVEPGKLNWAANPGGDRAQRLAEHRSLDTHAVVHTHQAFRDDMLHVLATHWGVKPEAAQARFMALKRPEAAAALRDAWKQQGIDYQMLMVDEGHGLLDRTGKEDSLLSRIAQAASDTTPYYMSASADPVKNDVTELRSLLDKLEPSGRYSDAGEWKRRYAVNTIAAAEALKREVAPYIYAASVPTGNRVNRRRETVPLHPEQQKQYAAVLGAFDRLRVARDRGTVDVEAARTLVPARFEGKPAAEHEAIARAIQRNPGTLKEQALARVVDMAPRESNAKIQHLVKLLKDHPPTGRPVVVFAHNLKTVHETTEALAEAGHRVVSLTGADSAKERDAKRRTFQPESGEPKADVFVLSDAGQAGLNLQRGQALFQLDRPMTSMGREQRNGRIDRLGRTNPDLDLVDLTTDTPFEARAEERIARKYALRSVLTDPAADLDEHGIAGAFRTARAQTAIPERKVA